MSRPASSPPTAQLLRAGRCSKPSVPAPRSRPARADPSTRRAAADCVRSSEPTAAQRSFTYRAGIRRRGRADRDRDERRVRWMLVRARQVRRQLLGATAARHRHAGRKAPRQRCLLAQRVSAIAVINRAQAQRCQELLVVAARAAAILAAAGIVTAVATRDLVVKCNMRVRVRCSTPILRGSAPRPRLAHGLLARLRTIAGAGAHTRGALLALRFPLGLGLGSRRAGACVPCCGLRLVVPIRRRRRRRGGTIRGRGCDVLGRACARLRMVCTMRAALLGRRCRCSGRRGCRLVDLARHRRQALGQRNTDRVLRPEELLRARGALLEAACADGVGGQHARAAHSRGGRAYLHLESRRRPRARCVRPRLWYATGMSVSSSLLSRAADDSARERVQRIERCQRRACTTPPGQRTRARARRVPTSARSAHCACSIAASCRPRSIRMLHRLRCVLAGESGSSQCSSMRSASSANASAVAGLPIVCARARSQHE